MKKFKIEPGANYSKLQEIIVAGLIGEKIADYGWRFSIDSARKSGYNFSDVEVSVYMPRKKIPTIVICVPVDAFRMMAHFEKMEIAVNNSMKM